MISIDEAAKVAREAIHGFDTCTEYQNFFVFGNTKSPSDGGGVVAISKETGEPMTFIAVLGELGKEKRKVMME